MTYEPRIGDGSEIPFSCDRYLGLELTTDPKTDFVRLPCGLGDKASAATLLEGDLPEALSEGAFVSALTYSIYD
ncbi:hypothetical protein JZU69_06375, partial [bacterium]|nr:hypothetical protein [bacterium]